MSRKSIGIALLGLGTVGSGVYKILQLQRPELENKLGADLKISKILIRDIEKASRIVADKSVLTTDWNDIVNDPQIDIVIEVMGGIEPASSYIRQALEAGRHVVTANKDLIAEQGMELMALADRHGAELLFEAAVAGGIPIIGPLRGSLTANYITEIMGIVNGTTNYILSKMTEEGVDFGEALGEATRLGYAEADPTADVDGLDAGRKMAIMASLAFNSPVTFRDVYTEGITKITSRDIHYADEFGRVIKLVGVAKNTPEGIEVRVHPLLIPKSHPLASVAGSYNAVFLHGDAVDDVMFYGRGAGDLPTGSAVMGDVFTIASAIVRGSAVTTRDLCYKNLPIKHINDTISCYYLRMEVEDKPGVLGTIAGVLGNNSVSIEQIVQKARVGDNAEIVVITDIVRERHLKDACLAFRDMSIVKTQPMMIRVY